MTNIEDRWRRCHALEARGMTHDLALELWTTGSERLITEVEAATDADIAALNAEWSRRHP